MSSLARNWEEVQRDLLDNDSNVDWDDRGVQDQIVTQEHVADDGNEIVCAFVRDEPDLVIPLKGREEVNTGIDDGRKETKNPTNSECPEPD